MTRRFVLPVVLGAVLASGLALAAFAALQALPRPTAPVVLGERLSASIASIRVVRSVERVGPRLVVRTICRRLAGQEYLLTILPRRRFLIDGASLTPLEARWHRGQTLAVEVALSGCPSLLTSLLERLVLPSFQRRAGLPVRGAVEGRRHLYRISLTRGLMLTVDRRTFAPLGLQLSLRRMRWTSVLTTTTLRKTAT